MRVAVIDCGTNTFNLLIAEISGGKWSTLFTNKIAVKLGKGGINHGVIRPERMARGLDALKVHYETMLSFDVHRSVVFATSAMREAENASLFIRKARELMGFEVVVIDGHREAQLIYEGVRQSFALEDAFVTIMDIGGGSTEFIIANRKEVAWKTSTPLGVSRMYDLITPEDPLSAENLLELKAYFDEHLQPVRDALEQFPSAHLVGASGSFDTLVDIAGFRRHERFVRAPFNRVDLDDFTAIHNQMLALDRSERLAITGMLPLRVDYMPIAMSLIEHVLSTCGYERLSQSEYAMKEGIVGEILEGKLTLE